jgi:hypothetical protein
LTELATGAPIQQSVPAELREPLSTTITRRGGEDSAAEPLRSEWGLLLLLVAIAPIGLLTWMAIVRIVELLVLAALGAVTRIFS